MKNRTTLLRTITLSFMLSFAAFSQAQNWDWAISHGGMNTDQGLDIGCDGSGNVYATGFFRGTASFDSFTMTSVGQFSDPDVYTLKHSSAGNVSWANQMGGIGLDIGYGIAVDSMGNSYVAGRFNHTANFHTQTLVSLGDYDMFLAKYDSAGNFAWARQAGGEFSEHANDVAVDQFGNAYVTGYFSDTAYFDGITLPAHTPGMNPANLFLAKYDANGAVQWAVKAGGNRFMISNAVSVDINGNVYVTGFFTDTVFFDNSSLTTDGSRDLFVAKYNNAGNVLWVQTGSGPNSDEGNDIFVDAAGQSYVTGVFTDSILIGTTTLHSAGGRDIFLVKFDTGGNLIWAERAGGVGNDIGTGVGKSPISGNIGITGAFRDNASFGNISLTSNGDSDIFLGEYSPSGSPIWIYSAGASSPDNGVGLIYDKLGNMYVTGHFQDNISFGPNTLTSNGPSPDCFIVKVKALSTSLEDAFSTPLSIFPNPFSEKTSIQFHNPESKAYGLKLYNVQGQVLRTIGNITADQVIVERAGLSSGLYYFQLTSEQHKSFRGRLIVQ